MKSHLPSRRHSFVPVMIFLAPTRFGNGNTSHQEDYQESVLLSCIKNVVIKNKHCLLDITGENIEIAMYAKLSPIVLLLKSTSLGELFEMRRLLVEDLWGISVDVPGSAGDPLNNEEVNRVFERAEKLEAKYSYMFTAKINANFSTANDHVAFFNKLKETIFDQQTKSTWVPVDKVNVDSVHMFLINVISILSFGGKVHSG